MILEVHSSHEHRNMKVPEYEMKRYRAIVENQAVLNEFTGVDTAL